MVLLELFNSNNGDQSNGSKDTQSVLMIAYNISI